MVPHHAQSAEPSASGLILAEERAAVGLARLNRPDARNALSPELMEELATLVERWDEDPAVRCIVIAGGDDWFAAGVVLFFEYEQMGVSRQTGIADLEKYSNRFWLSEMDSEGQVGPAVEQSLLETNYKDLNTPDFGRIVYKNIGLILQLPPGDYLSTWELSYDGEIVQLAEVTLHILSG